MIGIKQKRKILLVDDDELHLFTAKDILKKRYKIVTAESGEKALEIIYKRFIPDLIILDIIMPQMDGWETFHRLRTISYLQNVPIIFLTSMHEADEKERAHKMGAADFLAKPIERESLLKCVEALLKN